MPHKPQLDGLRFLAFLAVFYFHARPDRNFWGPEGVFVFLTLSGFLITRILILGESGDFVADLKRFYIRRSLRIFPLYYLVILWLWITCRLPAMGWFLSYTYNIKAFLTRNWVGGHADHLWTLSVEEQFYLLYPIAFLLTPSRRRPILLVALLVGSKLFQAYAETRLVMPWALFLLPYCGEFLLWGCLAGLIELKTKPGRWEGPLTLAAGAVLICLYSTHHDVSNRLPPPGWIEVIGRYSGFGLGAALVIFGLWRSDHSWIVAPLAFRPVAYLGRISYGLYVYHLIMLETDWTGYIPDGYLLRNPPGMLLGTIVVASASWYGFERPINRLKDRLTTPRGSGPAATEPVPSSIQASKSATDRD